ncbi:LOW QUALITY PROTEIN: cytoskeleton-associated protein 5-like [Pantherophis guttatus]|uniref:LOW QUALITY PROTEIN: cytoskeleton-associated protein 5-like n=1 Tax=Pantherophis guttatus TaxID=94885 RepID=A0A6P9AX78_PANGU|nr:LOW QUALITY PROTEIN: cytoskeleton-associated protein 5-like [Pantherophis guttatus]
MLMPRDMTEKELPEETCELEAAAVLPESCLQHLDSSNWKERISCLEALEKAVEEMENHQVPCQALVRLLHKEPGWNETKLQVMQKKLHIVTLIARKGNFSRTSARFVLGNLVDKIGDVICSSDTKEALMAVAEACGLPWTAEKVTEAAFLQDSPRTHAETLNWLSEAIRDFGFDGLEAKMFVGYIKISLTAAHPDVRTSAFNLLGVIFLYVGNPLRVFFENERPLVLAQIDARFEQLSGQSPPPQIRGRCRFCRNSANQQQGGDAQPYWKKNTVDLRQKISVELMSKMQDPSWKVRKEGLEEVSKILSDITSIQPNLGDLPLALKACLHDSNKALVKQTLVVLQQLAKAMGPGLKHHVKTLGMSILAVLKDSKSNLRPMALTTIEAWAEQTGMKEWLEGDELFTDLKKDMVSPRQGFLGWLAEKLPSSNSASADLLRCVPHLYSALENSHEETRTAAQEALPFFLLHLGIEKMCEATSKLKPASREQVLLLLERVKESRSSKATLSLSRTLSKLPRGKSWSRSDVAPPPPCLPVPSSSTENVGSNELSMDVRKAISEGTVPKTKRCPATKSSTKVALKEVPSKLGPIFMIVPKGKEQRAKEEKALKVLRWNFSTPSSKYIEQLKAQMSGCLSNWLQEEMFHSNFQHHIKALAVMSKHLEIEKDGVLSCLDLILKWLSLRLFDTNTWVLMKTLEYLQRLFHLLMEEKYQLTDNEVSSFLPYLLLKLGGTKESILKEVRAIVKQMFFIYPSFKTFSFLLEGAQAKNTNQRVGCLKELGWMLKKYGPEVCQPNPSKILKTLLVLTGDYNNAVHTAALKVIATARDVFGVETFRVIGNISEKHMGLLEDSIREAGAMALREEKMKTQLSKSYVEVSRQNITTGKPDRRGLFRFCPRAGECQPGGHLPKSQTSSWRPTGDEYGASGESRVSPNVNMIICHVASGSIVTSTEALVQIQEILEQEDNVELMSGHINPFLIAILRQMKFIHRLHVTAEEEARKEQVVEFYHSITCNLVSLFQVDILAQEASAGVLKDLISCLISFLLDSPVEELPEEQSTKLVVMKVLEKSNQTRILSSLLLLLEESMTASANLFAFSEMVAKCLWKTAKRLPQTIDSIYLDQILLDVHLFMKVLPKEKLKQYQSNYPLRALKILLHTLCKLKGEEILDHLTLIEDRGDSDLEANLRKVLSHFEGQPGTDIESGSSSLAQDEVNQTLGEIFKKINSKETARAGLEDLHEFKEKHPEADLEPYLKNCSLLFRSYVKHGLAVIMSERENKPKTNILSENVG